MPRVHGGGASLRMHSHGEVQTPLEGKFFVFSQHSHTQILLTRIQFQTSTVREQVRHGQDHLRAEQEHV